MNKLDALRSAEWNTRTQNKPYVAIKARNGQWMREELEFANSHYPKDAERVVFYPKCSCEYNATGQLVDTYGCIYHKANEPVYDKIRTKCLQYRPIEAVPSIKPTGFVWPRCKCGEIAQEH